jgi:MoaA/NifB/PqqE/SkfB family radical SAM enzyme
MYMQITTKCNMACGHCGMNCNKKSGINMSQKVFKAALKYASANDCSIVLGGGEPTVHLCFGNF